jgi:hypothetical protein
MAMGGADRVQYLATKVGHGMASTEERTELAGIVGYRGESAQPIDTDAMMILAIAFVAGVAVGTILATLASTTD